MPGFRAPEELQPTLPPERRCWPAGNCLTASPRQPGRKGTRRRPTGPTSSTALAFELASGEEARRGLPGRQQTREERVSSAISPRPAARRSAKEPAAQLPAAGLGAWSRPESASSPSTVGPAPRLARPAAADLAPRRAGTCTAAATWAWGTRSAPAPTAWAEWCLPCLDQGLSRIADRPARRTRPDRADAGRRHGRIRTERRKILNPTLENPGRQHWPSCWSAILAARRHRGGAVYGSTDRHASYVKDAPVRVQGPWHRRSTIRSASRRRPALEPRQASPGRSRREPILDLFG